MKSAYSYRLSWYEDILSDPDSFKVSPFCMYGNLYFVGTRDSAGHLIDTGDGLILFDTGYPNMQHFLIESIEELGFSLSDLKMIFHTHGHFDHFGATKLLTKISGATTLISAIDAKILRDDPRLSLSYYLPGVTTENVTFGRELSDGDIVRRGNTSVRCILTPGHTPGAMSYEITVSGPLGDKKALLCGGTGFNTLNLEFMEEYKVNYRPDFEKSLKLWKSMRPDIFLGNHTGQSRTLEKKENGESFIDREALYKYISEVEKNYFRMLAEEG